MKMAKSKQIKLAVLETAEWFESNRIMTVRPLFQQLMQEVAGDSNEFHYATFTGPASFQATMQDLVNEHGVNYIYIATHGEKGKIQFSHNSTAKVNVATFDCLDRAKMRGIFFGGCELGDLAREVSERIQARRARDKKTTYVSPWVVGYQKSVDWISGAFLDMAFWRLMLLPEEGFVPVIKRQKQMRDALRVFDEGLWFENNRISDKGEMMFPPLGETRKILGFSVYMNGKKIENDDEA